MGNFLSTCSKKLVKNFQFSIIARLKFSLQKRNILKNIRKIFLLLNYHELDKKSILILIFHNFIDYHRS